LDDMLYYLDGFVEPTIVDFENNPTSVRHAFIACVVTFHAIDYLAYPKRSRSRTMRQKARQASPDFDWVDQIAHAFKHVLTDRRDVPQLASAEVIERPPMFWDVAVWDLSRWDDAVGGVTLEKDRSVDILRAVKAAVQFLRSNAHRLTIAEP